MAHVVLGSFGGSGEGGTHIGACAGGKILLLGLLQKGAGSHNRLLSHPQLLLLTRLTCSQQPAAAAAATAAATTSDVDLFHICHFLFFPISSPHRTHDATNERG